jgi:uncharacterized RDD family membrane protein YckC
METIKVRTTQNVFIQYPIASVGDRIIAHILDRIILVVYSFAIVVALIQLEIEIWWLYIILLAVPWVFYNLCLEILMNGQTPGKRMMTIQVVRLDGTQPSVGDYLLRWIFGFIDFYFMSGVIAVIVIAAGGKGQRLGDLVAGTSVVKIIAAKEITADEVFIAPEESYVPTFPQVVQLAPRDIELIQKALDANASFGNDQPVALIAEKIKTLLGINTDLSDVQFLYTIVKDYNHFASH